MPRLARTVCAQVPHHITQRGNRREDVLSYSVLKIGLLRGLKGLYLNVSD